MPDRTFLELQNEALHDDFSQTKYRALCKRYLNEAQRRIFRRARVPEGESTHVIVTVPGDPDVDEAVDLVRMSSLRNTTDAIPLIHRSVDELDELGASAGKPTHYAQVGRRLVFWPTPDAAYNLEGRTQVTATEMVADDDFPQLVDDYCDLLVTWARSRLYRLEDDEEMSRALKEDFEIEFGQLRAEINRRRRGGRRQVPGAFAQIASPRFARP